MKKDRLFNMVFCGLFSAIIFVVTRFIQVPVFSGYVHFGDALIYIVASTLGGPWALAAASLGATFADISSGFVVYAPVTFIIKMLIALPFALVNGKSKKILTKITAFFTILAGIITVFGYFIADLVIYKTYAFVNIPGNVIQAVGSAVVFFVIGYAFDVAGIKEKIFLGVLKNG